jgi:hypothetical protein
MRGGACHRGTGSSGGRQALLEAQRVQRRREQEALELVAASQLQELPLRFGLHAFGDDLLAQRTRHLQDGPHDASVALVAGQAADEAAVDLELADGKRFR